MTAAFTPAPNRPPPDKAGAIAWLAKNFFYSWYSSALTLLLGYALFTFGSTLYDWAIVNAVWTAESRRQCLDLNPAGACWAGVKAWSKAFLYGRYPEDQQWRIRLALLLLVLWLLPLWLSKVKAKATIGAAVAVLFPFLAGYLFAGGERSIAGQIIWCAAVASLLGSWLYAGAGLLGFSHRYRPSKTLLGGAALALFGAVYLTLGNWYAVEVKTQLWGGLMLTLSIAGVAMITALPAGILLALARCSTLPVLALSATAFIELFCSVPLITILFMSVTMLPLFLPPNTQPDLLTQTQLGVCLFAAAYMAEVVRGGLQAVARGQYETAAALGLGYWQATGLVVLPQALRLMIPNIVGIYIGLLKDTTLVAIIGLYDFLSMLRAASADPLWSGLHKEPLLFGAIVYFLLCFTLSRYSRRVEYKPRR